MKPVTEAIVKPTKAAEAVATSRVRIFRPIPADYDYDIWLDWDPRSSANELRRPTSMSTPRAFSMKTAALKHLLRRIGELSNRFSSSQ